MSEKNTEDKNPAAAAKDKKSESGLPAFIRNKCLIIRGLPRLKEKPSGSECGASIPRDVDHPQADLIENMLPTGLIEGIRDKLYLWDSGAVWNILKDEKELRTGDEISIRPHVCYVLLDIGASLQDILGPQFRLSFRHELGTFGDAGGLWVVRANGMAVGLVEVVSPGGRDQNPPVSMTNKNILGKCYDHMRDVGAFDGVEHVFCILTDYHHWRVLWLPGDDSDEFARSSTIPEAPARAPAPKSQQLLDRLLDGNVPPWPGSGAPPNSLAAGLMGPGVCEAPDLRGDQGTSRCKDKISPAANERVLHGGPIIAWNDKSLISVLASVLVKMAFSPVNPLNKAIGPDRQYREVNPHTWAWKTLKSGFALKFDEMPDEDAIFLLIMPLGQGENGIAWLATSESGKACVIKFQAESRYRRADVEAASLLLQEEAARWRDIWGAESARAVTLFGKSALVMPFVRTCKGGVEDQVPETRELAVKAINRLLDRGYVHKDLRWDHVGLCRSGPEDKMVAIFVDLGNVGKLEENNPLAKEAAKKEMLDSLELP